MTDDTDHDARDREIARLSDRLGQSLAREAQQRHLNEELERQNRQLAEFTQMVSHDLRAPLRHVIGLAGFLRDDVGEPLPEIVGGRLGQIEERAQSMIGLVEDLLDYARAGIVGEGPTSADLQTLVTNSVRMVGDTEGIAVSIRCDLGVIATDTTPLSICVRNLADNAVKHHPGPTGTVAITARRDDNDLVVTVTDDGNGIDPIHHDRIFEPLRSLGGGTGLGLSTITRILDERGGSIAVDSELGRGSAFTITWPLTAEPVLDLAASQPPLVGTTSRATTAGARSEDQAE